MWVGAWVEGEEPGWKGTGSVSGGRRRWEVRRRRRRWRRRDVLDEAFHHG